MSQKQKKTIALSKEDGQKLNNLVQRFGDLLIKINEEQQLLKRKKLAAGGAADDVFKVVNANAKYKDGITEMMKYQNQELDMLHRRLSKGFDNIDKRLDNSRPNTTILLDVIGSDRKRLAGGGMPDDDKGQMEYFISLLQGMMKQGEGLSYTEEKALDDLLRDYERKYGKR